MAPAKTGTTPDYWDDACKHLAKRDRVMKKFGMLFQGGALFDSLPVWENVAFGLIQGRNMARNKSRDIAIEKKLQQCKGSAVERLGQLQASLKCGTNCGSCLPELKRLVRQPKIQVPA